MDNFSRYQIEREIGSGGMAKVFLARDTVLNRSVAIKTVHLHLLERPETIRRFSTEAHAVASLSHENIIKVFDYGESQGKRFIVMEYVDGISLLQLLERSPVVPNLVLLEIVHQVLNGMCTVHQQGIIHRDISRCW